MNLEFELPPLTDRQVEVLRAVRTFQERHGMPPTRAELGRRLGVAAQTADYHLRALQKKGYLQLGRKARAVASAVALAPPARRVPLLGRVAAGQPQAALEHAEAQIPVPDSTRADFALRVEGDSMLGVGIHDGDVVLVEQVTEARDGEIVVAIVGEGECREATVKRLRRRGRGFVLEAENPAYPDLEISPEQGLELAGRVVGLVRTWKPGPAARRKRKTG